MIEFADVEAAAERLNGVAVKTPVLTSSRIDEMLGLRACLKAENLQRTGSFKFRGAYNAVSAMKPSERQRGIVAISAGNHAQAVTLASRMHGGATSLGRTVVSMRWLNWIIIALI